MEDLNRAKKMEDVHRTIRRWNMSLTKKLEQCRLRSQKICPEKEDGRYFTA